jgi:PhoH-like ATPase
VEKSASTATSRSSSRRKETKERTYVLDTSVLLSDPRALFRFAEHHVVLPVVVISELEKKRHDPEIGFFARQALRHLDDLRSEHERLDFPIAVGEGGTLRVELNHSNQAILPSGLQLGDNDSRILAVALNLANDGLAVTVVSKDLPMRVKAASIGLAAEEYRAELAPESGWTGMAEIAMSAQDMATLYDAEVISSDAVADMPVNTSLVISSERGSALGRVSAPGKIAVVRGDRELFGLNGRSAAGTGKSALALCAGLEAVLEKQQHRKIMVFRPLYAVGGQDLGYLPGDAKEKMNPWAEATFDTLSSVVSHHVVEEVMDRGLLEVLPLTHIRGRSLHDAFVIVDEAQSLERNVLLTMLSRIGQNSRVVLTHDIAQRDNLRVGRHDGVFSVIEALKGQPLFGHITLMRSERSAIAALVTDLLEEGYPAA